MNVFELIEKYKTDFTANKSGSEGLVLKYSGAIEALTMLERDLRANEAAEVAAYQKQAPAPKRKRTRSGQE